jgi:hypothetical protein
MTQSHDTPLVDCDTSAKQRHMLANRSDVLGDSVVWAKEEDNGKRHHT